MKKKVVYILIAFIVLIVIATGIFLIYKKIDKNNKEKKQIEEKIISSYTTFNEKKEIINSERKVYLLQIESNMSSETLEEYENWINEVNNYTVNLDNVEQASKYLKEKCIDTTYKNQDVQIVCDQFISAYETAINYYVKDIISFNETLKNVSNGSKPEFELKYNYTDINKDGKFVGKD